MSLQLDSMALEMPEVSGHPNRMPFRGVLTYLDQPSDRPPAGARGHRVVLTRAAAEKALPSLLGMAVDFTPSLDGHDAQRKVGVITGAWIVALPLHPERQRGSPIASRAYGGEQRHPERQRGSTIAPTDPGEGRAPSSRSALARDVVRDGGSTSSPKSLAIEVQGHLFARDFPQLAQELQASAADLGMSYEVADAHVEDMQASIWRLTQVTFTGAAILRKDKAAYRGTTFELQSKDVIPSGRATSARKPRGDAIHTTGAIMNEQLMQQFTEAGTRLAAAAEALEQSVLRLDAQQKALGEKLERVTATVEEAANSSAQSAEAKTLYERVVELEKQNAELKAQSSRAASAHALRKTLPPTVSALLAKSGVESGERVEIATLDKILSPLSLEQRIAVKDQMAQAGMIA